MTVPVPFSLEAKQVRSFPYACPGQPGAGMCSKCYKISGHGPLSEGPTGGGRWKIRFSMVAAMSCSPACAHCVTRAEESCC